MYRFVYFRHHLYGSTSENPYEGKKPIDPGKVLFLRRYSFKAFSSQVLSFFSSLGNKGTVFNPHCHRTALNGRAFPGARSVLFPDCLCNWQERCFPREKSQAFAPYRWAATLPSGPHGGCTFSVIVTQLIPRDTVDRDRIRKCQPKTRVNPLTLAIPIIIKWRYYHNFLPFDLSNERVISDNKRNFIFAISHKQVWPCVSR